MKNRIKIALASGAGLIALLGASFAHATELSSSTLGASINTLNSTFYDYFVVLLTNYWPFVVGVGVLMLVWHFGRRALHGFN